MESDMIVEAFRSSYDIHGLDYRTLILETESSVYKKRWRLYLMEEKGVRQSCCEVLHKNVIQIAKLKNAVQKAIAYNAKQKNTSEDLKYDVRNFPNHVLGIHKECRPYYCNSQD